MKDDDELTAGDRKGEAATTIYKYIPSLPL